MRQSLSWVATILITLALSACGTVQGYPGAALRDSEVATIKISDPPNPHPLEFDPGGVQIVSVDGDRLIASFADSVTLTPGCHSLAVMVLGDHIGGIIVAPYPRYYGCAKFLVRVEAGRTYLMRDLNREYIAVHDLTNNVLVGRGSLQELGPFDACGEAEENTSAQCVPLEVGADEIRGPSYIDNKSVLNDAANDPGPDAISTGSTGNYDGLWIANHGPWEATLRITNGRYRLEAWCNSSKRVGGRAAGTLESDGRFPPIVLGHNNYQTTASGYMPEIDVITHRNYYCPRGRLIFERVG